MGSGGSNPTPCLPPLVTPLIPTRGVAKVFSLGGCVDAIMPTDIFFLKGGRGVREGGGVYGNQFADYQHSPLFQERQVRPTRKPTVLNNVKATHFLFSNQ